RPGCVRRVAAVLDGARPLRAPGDRVRDLRLGPEVRGPERDRAGLDAVRGAAGRGRRLAGVRAAVERSAGRRRTPSRTRIPRSRAATAHDAAAPLTLAAEVRT